jgi:hypothetical protein
MKALTALIASLALATGVMAGPAGYPSKNPKAPLAPLPTPPAPGCGCFGAGSSLDIFGAAIRPEGGDECPGGGVGLTHFWSRNVGLDLNYSVFSTNKEHHELDAALIFRAPIDSLCVAPYAIVGGGYATNSSNRANVEAGAGIDIRMPSWNCMGVFAEGSYHFAQKDGDYTTVRLGLRIPF